MSLAQLKKVEIYGLQEERSRLLKELQELGLMEITEFTEDNQDQEAQISSEQIREEYLEQGGKNERKLAEIGRALNFLEQIAPVKPTFIQQFAGVKTYLTEAEFKKLAVDEGRLKQLLDELLKIEQDLVQIQSKKNQLETIFETFEPWRNLDLTADDLEGTKNTQVILGTFDGQIDRLRQGLAAKELPVYMEVISREQIGSLLLFIVLRENQEEVLAFLNSYCVSQITLPPFEGLTTSKLNQLQQDLERLSKTEGLLKDKAASLNRERPLLQVFYDSLLSEKERIEITNQLIQGERSFAVRGWIIADQLMLLQERLSKTGLIFVLRSEDPAAGEATPVALVNNPVLRPFEYLVESFSYPQSHDVDPTPVIAPFFFIFFGIAFGDAGYGLILSLICAGLLLFLKMGPTGRKLSWMFLISGIAAIGFGLITGSVLSLPNIKIGIFNPLENPIMLLLIALALGLIQLYLGVIISAWNNIKTGHWWDVIWNQGFWLLFLSAVVLVLFKDAVGLGKYSQVLNISLLVASVGVVINNTRGKKGFFKKILAIPGGLYTIYGSIGFFSDVFSYSRLMALGLSGGVMGGIMNQLAWMVVESIPVLGWVLGGAIFLFGHALNLALSILGAYVHSSRLQYLEFFGKFYEGGGKPLTPFKSKSKYTFLINEREA